MTKEHFFGKIETRSTERKIWRHDKRTGGADYANRKQIERLGAEKALEHQLFSLAAKYKLRPVPYPEWLRHSPGTPLPFTGAASSSVAPVDCPEQWS